MLFVLTERALTSKCLRKKLRNVSFCYLKIQPLTATASKLKMTSFPPLRKL